MQTEDYLLRIAQLEQLLEAKAIQLKQVTQELDDISFAVSHDLKAPIRAIAGFAAILVEEAADLSTEGRRVIGVIERNTQKLSGMLNDIITYSSLSKKTTVIAKVNMQQMAHDALNTVMPGQVQANVSIDDAGLKPCMADESMMKQLWINLLHMCLFYADKNGFKYLHLTSDVKDNYITYTVTVKNVQPYDGVMREMRIGDLPYRETVEGNGTAASYIKRVLFKHNGSFWIQSLPGHNCTFNFNLPV